MNFYYKCECGYKFLYETDDPQTKCPICRNKGSDDHVEEAQRAIILLDVVSEELTRVFNTNLNLQELKCMHRAYESIEETQKALQDYIDLCLPDRKLEAHS